MALKHAQPGEVVDLQPLAERLAETETSAIVCTSSFEAVPARGRRRHRDFDAGGSVRTASTGNTDHNVKRDYRTRIAATGHHQLAAIG